MFCHCRPREQAEAAEVAAVVARIRTQEHGSHGVGRWMDSWIGQAEGDGDGDAATG